MTYRERMRHHCDISEWYWRQAENTTTDLKLTRIYVAAALATGACMLELSRGDEGLLKHANELMSDLDKRLPRCERVVKASHDIIMESKAGSEALNRETLSTLDHALAALREALRK